MKREVIVYDANFSVHNFRGMGKYINSLVKILGDANYKLIGLLRQGVEVPSAQYVSFGSRNYIFWEQFSFLKFLLKKKGVVIFPYNTAPLLYYPKDRDILIVHDLIFFNDYETANLKQLIGKKYRKYVISKIISRYKNIIVVSNFTKNALINRFSIDSERICVLFNNVEINNHDFNGNTPLADKKKFIFHIGGEPEYKNSISILYAFALLPKMFKNEYRLRMVGINDKKTKRKFEKLSRKLGIIENLELLPFQTQSEIEALYKDASMFIFPSIEEGFGIPIIESFKFGCPLLCSNSSCFPEIAGGAAYYFDPKDYSQIAKNIQVATENNTLTLEKIELGYKRVKTFSQEKFREKVYQEILPRLGITK